jgi:hypothetical protein
MGDDSVLDTSVASVESTVSREESEAEGEPLPPLRYGTPAAPSLAKADVRYLDVEWAAVEEVSGEELIEGEAKPTLCYVLEMQPVWQKRGSNTPLPCTLPFTSPLIS